jgi:hypothetical protein
MEEVIRVEENDIPESLSTAAVLSAKITIKLDQCIHVFEDPKMWPIAQDRRSDRQGKHKGRWSNQTNPCRGALEAANPRSDRAMNK